MKKLRLLALILAMVMLVAVFASCGDKNGDGDTPPAEPMTFSSFINPETPTLEDVVTKMEAVAELDGYVRMTYEYYDQYGDPATGHYDEDSEFIFLEKLDVNTGFKTYKVFSLRNGKVVATFTNTADAVYNLEIIAEYTPTFSVEKVEKIWLDPEHLNFDPKYVRTLYDANGAAITTKTNENLNAPSVFYDWVIIDRNLYTIDKATGALTKGATIPRNLSDFEEDNVTLLNNHIYVETSSGIAIYDTNFSYIGEWFAPVNVSDYRTFILNDGNVLIQYSKRLAPDAIEYDYYEGNNANTMVKYDLVTELFSVETLTAKNVECASYIQMLLSSNYIRAMYSRLGEDASKLVGEFENIAITYPIQEKKLNMKQNVIDFVLVDNNAAIGKSLKLVPNQTGLPEKIADNLYRVSTTYGYALTDVEGKVVKQVTSGYDYQVGDYFVYDDGIYNLSFECVYNYDEKNAVEIGHADNTVFVRQYATAEKNGDYTVLAFSKGEPKEICKYVKANANNVIFDLDTGLDIYSLYNQETKLYTYYNADGTVLLKDFSHELQGAYEDTLAWYVDSSSGTPIVKYVAITGNFDALEFYFEA